MAKEEYKGEGTTDELKDLAHKYQAEYLADAKRMGFSYKTKSFREYLGEKLNIANANEDEKAKFESIIRQHEESRDRRNKLTRKYWNARRGEGGEFIADVGEVGNFHSDYGWTWVSTPYNSLEKAKKEADIRFDNDNTKYFLVVEVGKDFYFVVYRSKNFQREGTKAKRVYDEGGNLGSFNYTIGGL